MHLYTRAATCRDAVYAGNVHPSCCSPLSVPGCDGAWEYRRESNNIITLPPNHFTIFHNLHLSVGAVGDVQYPLGLVRAAGRCRPQASAASAKAKVGTPWILAIPFSTAAATGLLHSFGSTLFVRFAI